MLKFVFKTLGLFCLILFAQGLFAQQKSISIDVNDAALQEVISFLEAEYGFLFSYKASDIADIHISIKTENSNIESFLDTALSGKPLEYEIVDNNYIILKKKTTEEDQLSGNKQEDKKKSTFCGTVIDSFTQKPLAFANVFLAKSMQGSYSTEAGKFSFTGKPRPKDSLTISYVGYEEKRFKAIDFTSESCPTVALNYLDFGEGFVIITDYLTDGINLGDHGTSTVIHPNRMSALPGQVEPDILHTLQFLPGISSVDGAAANINIRGGSSDQNLILWEGIPIYHSAHYFGTISAFNPYIIDKMKVYRGGFGAESGCRVSGVIDLTSPDHEIEDSDFGIGANFINAYTYGKVSLFDKKASLVYSARRSMTELWRSPMFENITLRNLQGILIGNFPINDLPPDIDISDDFNFFDTHLKASYQFSEKDEMSIAWFWGNNIFADSIYHDRRKQIQKDDLILKNQGLSFSWRHQWNEKLSSKLTGISTSYDQDYEYSITVLEGMAPDKFGIKDNTISEKQIHLSNQLTTENELKFDLGYHFTDYDVDYKVTQESNDLPLANETDSVKTAVHVLYASFQTPQDKKFGVSLGTRWSYYGKKKSSYFEPRASAWYKVTDDLSLHLNAGQYYQFIGQLIEFRGDNAGIETPIWVMTGDGDYPVLNANQFQAGILYNKKSWVIDLQAYHKKINGLTSLATGFDLSPQKPALGRANIKGIDLLVKKRWKKYRTWISYSLSKADFEFPTFFDQDFPAPYDQRHTFNWANLLTFGDLELSLGWKFSSGNPYSLMDRFFIDTDPMDRPILRPVYEEFYSRRLQAQHQVNASVLYHIRPERKDWKGVIGLSILNVFQRENIYKREYYIDRPLNQPASIKFVDHTNLGFTPNMVLRFEW